MRNDNDSDLDNFFAGIYERAQAWGTEVLVVPRLKTPTPQGYTSTHIPGLECNKGF